MLSSNSFLCVLFLFVFILFPVGEFASRCIRNGNSSTQESLHVYDISLPFVFVSSIGNQVITHLLLCLF